MGRYDAGHVDRGVQVDGGVHVAGGAPADGFLVTVEEDLHVLGADHLALVPQAPALLATLVPAVAGITLGGNPGQLLLTTPPCAGAEELGEALRLLRGRAGDAARAVKCRIAACGLPPLPPWPGPLGKGPYPAGLRITVSGPGDPAARLAPVLPALLALSASSPFADAADTGWASSRWRVAPQDPPVTLSGDAVTLRVCDAVPRVDDVVALVSLVLDVARTGRPGPASSRAELDAAAHSGVVIRTLSLAVQDLPKPAARRMRAAGSASAAARLVCVETVAGAPQGALVRQPNRASPDADERRLLAERPPHHG